MEKRQRSSTCPHTRWNKLCLVRSEFVKQCRDCELIITPSLQEIDVRSLYVGGSRKHYLEYQTVYRPARLLTYKKILGRLEAFRNLNRIVDIGSSYGDFLELARTFGWRTYGVELSSYAVHVARREKGLEVHEGDLESAGLPEGYCDVVTLWDVIEHVRDPLKLLCACNRILRPGGAIVLKTPDARALSQNRHPLLRPLLFFYRQLAYPANPAEHVHHFLPATIADFLEDSGFAVNSFSFDDDWPERPLSARFIILTWFKTILSYVGWRLGLPYEMIVVAQK